ncbi:MAG: sugar transferase [Acidaminococcaceae bacterium]|nr:sugar transferase [Acidaminococcaceae bacterium]
MNSSYLFFKRIFDIVASFLSIIFFLIPWIFIGIFIKIQSPGPAIFRPIRIGKDGKPFVLYKFRSMRVDSGAIHVTTLRNDTRIFPFGSFLRKSKLDETPQLINILKGEMSVIGPRPEDKINADRLYVGKYKEILSVKPGLSSPASLYDYTHGELYETEEEYVNEFEPKKLDVELYYVKHRTMLYDLQVVWRTMVTILQIVLGKADFEEPEEVLLVKQID